MNIKFNHYCGWVFSAGLIITLALILSFSGCVGFESRTNLSIEAPESVEVAGRNVEMLAVELSPDEADAKNVVVNLSAPPGISLTDPHSSFQQYSREFNNIPRGKKERIFFNFSATFASDEYILTLEAKADNANITRRTIKVNLSIPAPEWEIGEYWVLNQTTGDLYGKHVQKVLRKESQGGKDVYVVKDTLAREVNGTYRLYYYTVEGLEHIKTEYYENDTAIGRMAETIDPPSLTYGFPFKIGKTWNWSGTVSGIGRTEFKGEVLEREKISVQGRSYDAYKIRLKYTLPLGTSDWYVWYSPDSKRYAAEKGKLNVGNSVKESNTELIQYGSPSDPPPDIQPAVSPPPGWRTYVDKDRQFSFNYPEGWKLSTPSKSLITLEEAKTNSYVLISVEPVGKMTLEEYAEKIKSDLGRTSTVEENYKEVNGRRGYEISTFLLDLWGQFRAVIFVANENGYMIFNVYGGRVYYPPEAFDVINSFVIKEPPVYTLLERK